MGGGLRWPVGGRENVMGNKAEAKGHAKRLQSSFVSSGEMEGFGDNERSFSYYFLEGNFEKPTCVSIRGFSVASNRKPVLMNLRKEIWWVW